MKKFINQIIFADFFPEQLTSLVPPLIQVSYWDWVCEYWSGDMNRADIYKDINGCSKYWVISEVLIIAKS